MTLTTTIAKTIRAADSSYFFENYEKQAAAVVAVLRKEGLAMIPRTPSATMVEAGLAELVGGRIRPEVLIENIWTAMHLQALKENPLA